MLDSGQMLDPMTHRPRSQFGRYDIIVAEPVVTLVTQGDVTTITQGRQQSFAYDDPFALVKRYLTPQHTEKSAFPFTGGALGYFGYDLGRRIEHMPSQANPDPTMPEMMLGIYDWAVVVDHRLQRSTLVSHQQYIDEAGWQALCALFSRSTPSKHGCFAVTSPVQSNMDAHHYAAAFTRVQDYISAGDCYQVNLAQRFSAQVAGDAWTCYLKLRELSPAPFMAYMDLTLPDGEKMQVMSVSPERFLQLVDRTVETRPIKGTRPRYADPKADQASADALVTSLKDKAENVMIVDLLRNDISKVCRLGSVKADTLFQLQSFANVHHLVSYITGQLTPHNTAIDLLRSCFPGGSITGAPKVRSMQIIEELEPHRRVVYCGCIGYIDRCGDMDTNIAIRTAVVKADTIYFYAGGGVVADSTVDKEYKETFDKASNFLSTMQFFVRDGYSS